jgi:hypothetical protein
MALGGFLALLLGEVLIEPWLVELLGSDGPKFAKNGLILIVFGLSIFLVLVKRRWNEFRTRADAALAMLAAVMLVSAILNEVGPGLTAKALYVYLRGAVVFIAVRTLVPQRQWTRWLLVLAAGWSVLNALLAVVQVALGPKAYTAVGLEDLSNAAIHRGQGFFSHPNELGHLLGLALLTVFVWPSRRRWQRWLMLAVLGAGLAATQSRESLLGAVCGIAVLAAYRRTRLRRVAAAVGLLAVVATIPLLAVSAARVEATRRLWGVVDALGLPITHQAPTPDTDLPVCGPPEPSPADHLGKPGSPCRHPGGEREIRILYAQQGLRLLAERPALGYGDGTFGGIVAMENDPHWNMHPRFGPNGFNMHGFPAKTVDSFWLHLLVETGALGLIAYLAWLWTMCRPVYAACARAAPVVILAPALTLFGIVVAVFSPALEGPLLPPLLFAVLGNAWTTSTLPQAAR